MKTSIYLSNEEKEQILRLYESGNNTVQIGEILERNNSTIGRYLKKQGKINHGYRAINNIDAEIIREMYIGGKTSHEIYQQYKHKIGCEETIQYFIRKEGISRKRGYRNDINHDYFENIDTATKAYFLGLLLTDGNVHKYKREDRQKAIQISLKLEDKYIIETFKKELCSSRKISEYKKEKRNEACFSAISNKMADDLKKYDIVERKTFLINKIPEINSEFVPDLIRGIFDGDGTVYTLSKSGKLRFGFYGTYNLITDILYHLNTVIETPKNKVINKGTVSFVTFGKLKDINNFYNYIYYNKNIVCLKRKRVKFETYLNCN